MKKRIGLIVAGLAVGVIAGVSVRSAWGGEESDNHRMVLALERQTQALEKIAHALEAHCR